MGRRMLIALWSVLVGTGLIGADAARADSNFDAAGMLDTLVGQERAVLDRLAPGRITQISRLAPAKSIFPRKKPQVEARYTEAWLAGQPVATGGKEWECLTQALYFEARGETVKGLFAVSEVILNRVESARYPDSVCGVVNQGTGRKHACQFSFTCDGHEETVSEPAAWKKVGKVARIMLDGAPRALTHGATHYHTTAVSPRWAARLSHTVQIGVHKFYR